MFRRTWLAGFVLVLGTAAALASPSDRWLHVRVIGAGEDGEKVIINLPLPLIETALPAIRCDAMQDGRVRIDLDDSHVDLAALRAALQQSQDGEYVNVEDHGERVRIAKEDGWLLVHAEEPDETVDIRLRLSVVEALFSSGTDELDLRAALRVLAEQDESADLVRVEGEDESVRIWIDERPTAD
jgi:hypothetical protein